MTGGTPKRQQCQGQGFAATKSKEPDKKAENDLNKGSASDDSEDAADHKRLVEGEFAADDVGGEPLKKGACQHADVNRDSETFWVRRVEFKGGLGRDNGLNKEDQGVDGVAGIMSAYSGR